MILTCFLGISAYESCAQFHHDQPEQRCHTPYIQTALAVLAAKRNTPISEIRILATKDAWKRHGTLLTDDLQKHGQPAPRPFPIPDGSSENEFWEIFETLRAALKGEQVTLDITHGFRAQPFFAAAVIQYMAALKELPADLQLHYGRLSGDRSECLIWDLSSFLLLQQWSAALDGILSHGKGHALTDLSTRLEADVRRGLARNRNHHLINARDLVKALGHLSDAIATVRIPHIISHAQYENHNEKTPTAHADEVISQIDNCRESVNQYMPALAPLLNKLAAILAPLRTASLDGDEGLTAQHALAKQYLDWQRPAEASIVMREAHVGRYVTGNPLDGEVRRLAETRWIETDSHGQQSIAGLRNDIQHGGWRTHARQGKALYADLENKHKEFDCAPAAPDAKQSGRTLLISRHTGALEWLSQQGYKNSEIIEHLDRATIDSLTPEDTVVGNLPIHLAAEISQRRSKFLYLQIDLPQALRGKELTAEELDQCNVRLAPYIVYSGSV